MKKILILGGTTFDLIISMKDFPVPEPQTIHFSNFHEATGSTGSGKALSLAKLGIDHTLFSILGNDHYGIQIIKYLQEQCVNLKYEFDPKGTERHVNIMNEEGERISIFITQSSEHPNIDLKLIDTLINQHDIVVLNIIAYCKLFIPILKKFSKPIWTDLHDYTEDNPYHEPFIDASEYIFLSSDNLKDYQKIMYRLLNRGKELIVCTHGKKGATALTKNGEWIHVPAIQGIKIVDTNGAGDCFFSGFLYAFLKGREVKECMEYASICGAYCVTSQQVVSDKLTEEFLELEYKKIYQ